MSPRWTREDQAALIEARRLQVELAETAAILMAASQRLSNLVAELNDEAEEDEDERER